MSVSVLVSTFGDLKWARLAEERAIPSTEGHGWGYHDRFGTVTSARNEAAEQSTADWLCFLDADDELAPGYVAAMERAIGGYDPSVGFDPRLFTPAVSHRRLRPGRPVRGTFRPEKNLADHNWLVIGTLISRELFWQIGGFDEQDPHGLEDWSLWTRAAAAGATVVKVPDAVYVAHTRRLSSHVLYARNPEYGREYTRIRRAAWPELYEDVTC